MSGSEPSSGPIAHDGAGDEPLPRGVACCVCGYDLAGLSRMGLCPECATEIQESHGGVLAILQNIEYLSTLLTITSSIARGLQIAIATIAWWMAVLLLMMLAAAYFPGASGPFFTACWVIAALALPVWGFWLWARGWWRLSRLGDPAARVERMGSEREHLRLAVAAQGTIMGACLVGMLGMDLAVTFGAVSEDSATTVHDTIMRISAALLLLATAACVLPGMALVRDRFARFGRPKEAKNTRRAGRSFALSLCAFIVCLLMPADLLRQGGGGGAGACVFLVVLVWAVAAYVGFMRCVLDLKTITQAALERAIVGGNLTQGLAHEDDQPL